MHASPMRRTSVLVALTLASVALAGCTATEPAPVPSSNGTSDAGPQIIGQSPGVRASVDVPADLENDMSKRGSVSIDTCAATATGWSAGGTVRNSASSDGSYFITVFFADAKGTVVGWAQAIATAPTGAENSWSVDAAFAAPAQTMCVLAAVS